MSISGFGENWKIGRVLRKIGNGTDNKCLKNDSNDFL